MKKITFFLFGLIALVACEAELETEKANSLGDGNRMTRSGLTISPEEAAAQALEFRNDIMEQSGQTRGQKAEKGVTSVYAWRSSEIAPKSMTRSTASELLPDTLLYIVNFEDSCGYALVSADALVPGVAAYIEKGNLSPDQEIDNPGFKSFLEGYQKYVLDSLRRMPDSVKIYHRFDTLAYPFKDSVETEIRIYEPYQTVNYVAPLLTTKWGQDRPYNDLCPNDKLYGSKCAAGCVAIAVGQVVAYYEYPILYNGHSYNWGAIKENEIVDTLNYEGASSVAMLTHDIGQLVRMHYYSRFESRASFDCVQYCLNAFNYHYNYNGQVENDNNAIKEDLLNYRPVIVDGYKSGNSPGHAWVIDGLVVKRSRSLVIPGLSKYREYVHCNWGWNGGCNGFFIFKDFETLYDTETDKPQTGTDAYVAGIWCGFNNWIHAYHSVCPNE